VSLVTLPPCPCAEYPRFPDDGEAHWIDNIVLGLSGLYNASFDKGYRMCTTNINEITPEILEYKSPNYDIDSLSGMIISIGVRDSFSGGCNYLLPSNLGYGYVYNGVYASQSFYPPVAPGIGMIFRFSVYLEQYSLPLFSDNPIVNVRYRLRRT
jgi:hypothetical protein